METSGGGGGSGLAEVRFHLGSGINGNFPPGNIRDRYFSPLSSRKWN